MTNDMKRLFTSSSTLWSCLIALVMMMASSSAWAEYVKLTALDGTGGTGGEGYPKLVDTFDGKDGRASTKWGHRFLPGSEDPAKAESWIILKADKAFTPTNYFLVTGNDTNAHQERNWKSWNIYGANFDSEADATKDAEAWTLIDQREDASVNPANYALTEFKMNDEETLAQYDGTPYQYYMIEVTRANSDAEVYVQMNEFGFGTYAEFQVWLEVQAADPTKPVTYKYLAGSGGYSNEGTANLIDGQTNNKWCTGFTNRSEGSTQNGAYIVFKASRYMAPTYYTLVTGNDTRNNPGRNWRQWQIYGMNASSDSEVKRTSNKWVAIDKKYGIGSELPADNYATAYFSLSEGSTTAYKYFKIEIDEIQSGGTMQMTEFAFGDQYTLDMERVSIIEGLGYDPDLFAEKALLDPMEGIIASIEACDDPMELISLGKTAAEQMSLVNASANKYAELTTVRNQAARLMEEDNLNAAAVAYATVWISETDAVAPSQDYPVGNYAYIKANRVITGDEASAEARRFTTYLLSNTKTTDEPIYVTYETVIDANGFNDGEKGHSLVDGDRDGTKWCANSGHKPWLLVFKSSEPIKPTYYGLVTGGDTGRFPERNWKSWKIWAANFEEGETVTSNSDKWVLIDEKRNVGTDVLASTSLYESYINLSVGCAEPYQYFKIEVLEAVKNDLIQMNEFTFYNQGNFGEYREQFTSEFEDYDPEADPAYIGYINAYKQKYQELCTATNAPDLMRLKNELLSLQEEIAASAVKYSLYEDVYGELSGVTPDSESLISWFQGYTSENVGPCAKYIRGTYEYIMATLSLDNDAMDAEIAYLQSIIKALDEDLYILLGGHTVNEWGDGFYGNLIDGIAFNEKGYDDNGNQIDVLATKWGGEPDINGDTYIVFRTHDKTNPFFYTLTTGNDTQRFPERNWGTWYIYGANFEGDGAATKDAEGWVLIDVKENIGQERLHPVNAEPSYFGFSTETTEAYTYYKVVVTKAYSGNKIQMNELHFGTPDEFEEIKDEYIAKADEFDYDVVAEQALIDQYESIIGDIETCVNMEALFRANYAIETLQQRITESTIAYDNYLAKVEELIAYLEENPLADCEAVTILTDYLTADGEPSELYPNGTAEYILEHHVLADSVLTEEAAFMESLKLAAVAAGYVKGTDISSLIVNRTFAEAGETIVDEQDNKLGRKAQGWDGYIYRTEKANGSLYAAEFCNEVKTFDISQTLTGMKNGFYKVTLNAGYRANGNLLSYNYAPLAYANDVKTFIPVIREDAIQNEAETWKGYAADRGIYDADSTEFYGWGIWGCEGAANAFERGYYLITMVAQVTDGTLTFGLKNEGTKDNEWTAAGNFCLYYLGEEEADAEEALQEAADYNAARIATLTEIYFETEPEDYSDAPGFGAAQKETLIENSGVATYQAAKVIGEVMDAIPATKKAYLSLYITANKVFDKWINFYSPDADRMAEEVDAILFEGIPEGLYDAVTAKATEEGLLAKYPDYLEVVPFNEAVDVVPSDDEAFNFTISSFGRNPSVLMGGAFYDALTEDEVILAFEYSASEALPDSKFWLGKDADDTKRMEIALPAADELTPLYIDISKAVEEWGFGKTDDQIRWQLATGESEVVVALRHGRIITKAQMKAEGGKVINGAAEAGDLNGDGKIDIADAVSVLDIMASEGYDEIADLNGDGKIDIADFVGVLDIMAQQ